ncbi:MAG TPA: hypothetical protein DD383_01530 [Rikenellaceae bacterium]|nr:hypothetical protein [Rikenellaceae bacterium]HCQ72061.1 hypothetical protein [Rikenellaceae bacterium]
MNNIIKLFIALACVCVVSCAKDSFELAQSGPEDGSSVLDDENQVATKNAITDVTSTVKSRKVLASDVPTIIKNQLGINEARSSSHYSLNTIQKNGNPMLHIVNYDEGGWAIIAGNEREENQILAMSDVGHFDPDNITNSNVAFWFAMQLEQMEAVEFEDDLVANMNGNSDVSVNSIPPFDDEYVWVRLPLEPIVTTTIEEVGPLLTTKWGQGYPWNYNCPYFPESGKRAPTGCVAVAVAQLLYYYHFLLGIPSGLYHSIVPSYTKHGNYYTSSVTRSDYQANSSRWEEMAKTYRSRCLSTDYVGDFMIDIGERVDMTYEEDGSSATDQKAKDAFFAYGLYCSLEDYSPSKVISSLNKRKPVYIGAKYNTRKAGHSWVIDGYKCYSKKTDTPYKWVTMPPDSLQFYDNLNYDYVLNLMDKERFYPDVYEGQIDHYYNYHDTYYLKMNWGGNGAYDDGSDYTTNPDSWVAGAYTFNSKAKIIHDFKPKD